MSKSSRFVRALSVAALVGSMGCVMNPPPRAGVVYVSRRPPVERVEVIAARPGPAHVWITGHWDWRGSEFVWIGGRWEEPRAGFRQWVPGRWERDRHGWFWVEGRWR